MTRLTEIIEYAKLDQKARLDFAENYKGPVFGMGRFKLVDPTVRNDWIVVFVDSSWRHFFGERVEGTLILEDWPEFFCEGFELTSTYAAQEQRNLNLDSVEIEGRTAYVFKADYLLIQYPGSKGKRRVVFDPKIVDLRDAIALQQHPDLERAALSLHPWNLSRDRLADAKIPKKDKAKLQKVMNRPTALWSIGEDAPAAWAEVVRKLTAGEVLHRQSTGNP